MAGVESWTTPSMQVSSDALVIWNFFSRIYIKILNYRTITNPSFALSCELWRPGNAEINVEAL